MEKMQFAVIFKVSNVQACMVSKSRLLREKNEEKETKKYFIGFVNLRHLVSPWADIANSGLGHF